MNDTEEQRPNKRPFDEVPSLQELVVKDALQNLKQIYLPSKQFIKIGPKLIVRRDDILSVDMNFFGNNCGLRFKLLVIEESRLQKKCSSEIIFYNTSEEAKQAFNDILKELNS